MASVAHHPNVQLMTYSEIDGIVRKADGPFAVELHRKPAYVDFDTCSGCGKCEEACTVTVPDEYNTAWSRGGLRIFLSPGRTEKGHHRSRGEAPCTFTCPAGVKRSGYIRWSGPGRYEEAFDAAAGRRAAGGSLARACYAPCEPTARGGKEGTVHIRGIKRFMADRYYAEHPEPEYGRLKISWTPGSPFGPARRALALRYYLRTRGPPGDDFRGGREAGGMLRTGIPSYRLPKDVVDRDIKNVTALGVEIKTGHRIASLPDLKQQGFNAILIATGAADEHGLDIEGQDLDGVMGCMHFLHEVNVGVAPDLENKTVMVIGGGNWPWTRPGPPSASGPAKST